MTLADLKRWHWLVIGLLLGPLLAYCQVVRRQVNGYEGDSLHRPTFARYMRECNRPTGGSQNIVVHPHPLKGGWHIVTGQRYAADSDEVTTWWFEAQSPYLETSQPQQHQYADVMEFLQRAGADNSPVPYRWAWWERSDLQVPLWLAGTVVFFGVLWPTVLNLLAFGSVFRPAEEKVDLSGVRNTPAPEPTTPVPTDLSQVDRIGEELAAELAGAASACAPAPPSTSDLESVREMTATQLELTAEEKARQEREFGKEKDDF
jgi:hypothetical protein